MALTRNSFGAIQCALFLCLVCYTKCAEELECKDFKDTVCPCGPYGKEKVKIHVKMCSVNNSVSNKPQCEPCDADEIGAHACEKFKNCETCDSIQKSCASCKIGRQGSRCELTLSDDEVKSKDILPEKKLSDSEELQLIYPIHVRYPMGKPIVEHRLKREQATCKLPKGMSTVDFACIHYPDKSICSERCAWGHTFPKEGTVRDTTCHHAKDKWEPDIHEECKSFVNCKLGFASNAHISCTDLKSVLPPQCTVSCNDRPTNETYTCTIDGRWHPPLPPCVVPRTNVDIYKLPCTE